METQFKIEAQELLVNRRKREIISALNDFTRTIDEVTEKISWYRLALTNLNILKEQAKKNE